MGNNGVNEFQIFVLFIDRSKLKICHRSKAHICMLSIPRDG